jgi:hypothetical protein
LSGAPVDNVSEEDFKLAMRLATVMSKVDDTERIASLGKLGALISPANESDRTG